MRIFLACCLILLFVHESFSQKVWSIGPEVGVNFSKYGKDANENDYLAGFNGGIFLTYSVINTFGVTVKVLYSEKGAKVDDNAQRLKYIEIPLTGRFFLNKEGKFRPNFLLGPSIGFLQGVTNYVNTSNPEKMKDYESVFNTYDVGLTGGLGLNLRVFPGSRLLLDLRYTYGITDIVKAPGVINNEAVSATLGFSFGI